MKSPLAVSSVLATVLLLVLASAGGLNAQIPKSERRWIRVGSLQHYVNAYGSERAWNGSYYEGMIWPANYRYQDGFVSKRWWVGTLNWTDPNGRDWPVRATSFLGDEAVTRTTAMEFKQVARFAPTEVVVDGNNITAIHASQVDEIDPTQKPDRIVTNVVRTDIGLTMTRRVMAFSQQYHDNYLIYDYIYKNDGNTDADEEPELPGQTLHDVIVGGMVHLTTCREAAIGLGMGRISWGANQWQSKRGENYADYVAGNLTADSLRLVFCYLGQDKNENFNIIGGPDFNGGGRLTGAQHAGTGFLHVDTDGNNESDDPNQPVTLGWNGNDNFPRSGLDEISMREAYDMFMGQMIKGNTDRMDTRRKGYYADGSISYPNSLTDAGGAASVIGYGPFTLAFGDSIRIVEVAAVAGLSRHMCELVGRTWLEAPGTYTLPDGSSITSDKDEYKEAWVLTGRDSLFQTISRARRNFELGYDIPQPPQPPTHFTVESGGDRISLYWSAAAGVEEAPDFGGYRIFRAVSKPDTTYQEIFACGKGTDHPEIVHEFDDLTAVRGFPYYYYIVDFNDSSTNHSAANPGGELHSSRFYTQTTEPAYLRRQAGKNLDDIRIVPNPYNIRARSIQYGTEGAVQDRIMFLNIPAQCTIRIYTERGDLIKTIEHTDGSGDEMWNSVTSSRQVVVSGVYIVHFEATVDYHDPMTGELLYAKGATAVKKFVIIR